MKPAAQSQNVHIHVGVLIAHSPYLEIEQLQGFAQRMTDGAQAELEAATEVRWSFHSEEPMRLADDDARYPSDFLDQTSLRMVEGPYDAMVVVTDVPLMSRRRRVVPGLASSISRIVVVSTRKFVSSPRDTPARALDAPFVQRNSIVLLLHLFGHLLDVDHPATDDSIMSEYSFSEQHAPAHFSDATRRQLQQTAHQFPERTQNEGGVFHSLRFHLTSAARHPKDVLLPLWRNRAPLIPLALPRLATAAVAPTLILIFSAEIWDVAFNLTDLVAWLTALASVIIAAWYMMVSLNLFFPRKVRRVITEHAAVVNVSVFLTLLLAMIGLFSIIFVLMLAIEYFIFPPNLMREWPSLANPTVRFADEVRLAVFISTLGVITGALAGGLESRAVVRQFALWRKEP